MVEYAAGLWSMCGPLFKTVWANEEDKKTRATLVWRSIPMATVTQSTFTQYHGVDGDSASEMEFTKDSIKEYIDRVSHLDIILRKWPEIHDINTSEFQLKANGTVYAQVDMHQEQAVYTLIPGNRRPSQRTGKLDDLARYTEWLCQALETRETSHTVLFIDSMRRL